jgi:glycosyltransferase involved in cell wall biosynthesis
MTILAVYPWPAFWSMGEGRGSPSFAVSVTAFAQHGHEIHVLTPGRPDQPTEEDYHGAVMHRFRTRVDFVPDAGGPRVLAHFRLLWTYLYWLIRAVPAGLALAARVSPDVVFGMEKLGAPAAFAVARLRRIPNVTRLFGTELNVVAGNRLRLALRYRDIVAFRTPADSIIMHNDGSEGDVVARRLGVDMSRFFFLPDGLDKARFTAPEPPGPTASDLGVPPGHRVILNVGRLHPEKHVERLLRAAPGVLATRDDVTFLIVGGGDQLQELEAVARDLGVADHVVFAGAVRHDELPAVYRTSDIFVTLSDRTNRFNPLFEAMLSGTPVVALNTGSTGEVIEDGKTGLLLEPGDLHRLPDALLGLLSDDARRATLAAAALFRADEIVPTVEERQAMEVEIVERAVRETRTGRPERRARP